MSNTEENILSDLVLEKDQAALMAQFSILTLNSEGYFLLVGNDYKIIAFNEDFRNLYQQYFGITVSIGDSIIDYTPPERVEEVKIIYSEAFKGIVYKCELELPLPDNNKIEFKSIYRPAYNSEREIVGVILYSYDITEFKALEKQKEHAIQQIEIENSNFRALIDHSPDMIWSFDLNFNLINYNSLFEAYFNSTFNVKIKPKHNYLEVITHYTKFDIYKNTTELFSSGKSFTFIDYTINDTKEYWSEISFNPIFDLESKKITGAACISRDISEAKTNEKRLLLSTKRLKQAQRIAGLGSWHFDLKTKLSSLSDEALELFGISSTEFDYQYSTLLKRIHVEDQDQFQKAISEAVLLKKDFSLYYRIVKDDNSVVHVYTDNDFEYDDNGNAIGFYGIILNVSDRVIKEAELKKLLFLTQKHNEWLNNFTHIVSHNIRSNNNNIKSLVELLIENSEGDRELLLKMLKTSTNKLDETIYHLSEFVKFQNQNEKNYALLNLKKEIAKSTDGINQHIIITNSTIINAVSEQINIKVVPAFLESILMNMLTNAIKYRSPDRPLVLKYSSELKEDYCILTIEDNGIGIDMDKNRNSIFGLFKTFNGNSDSVGLGLFMTKNQIELMQGKIEIESTLGKGTIFKIYFYEKN
jgi:PAS domain-containing protein/anti-sigma regulatory factor (Ser/Thr protein kinase)